MAGLCVSLVLSAALGQLTDLARIAEAIGLEAAAAALSPFGGLRKRLALDDRLLLSPTEVHLLDDR